MAELLLWIRRSLLIVITVGLVLGAVLEWLSEDPLRDKISETSAVLFFIVLLWGGLAGIGNWWTRKKDQTDSSEIQ